MLLNCISNKVAMRIGLPGVINSGKKLHCNRRGAWVLSSMCYTHKIVTLQPFKSVQHRKLSCFISGWRRSEL